MSSCTVHPCTRPVLNLFVDFYLKNCCLEKKTRQINPQKKKNSEIFTTLASLAFKKKSGLNQSIILFSEVTEGYL